MTTAIRDFSLLVSQREVALVTGKINGTLLSNEGKLVVIIVDNSDWVLRVTLSTDGLKATIVNAQRIHPLLEAAIMVTHVKIDSRVDKARLTIATAGDRSSVHVQKPEFSRPSTMLSPHHGATWRSTTLRRQRWKRAATWRQRWGSRRSPKETANTLDRFGLSSRVAVHSYATSAAR